MTVALGEDMLEPLSRLVAALEKEGDAVMQQKLIELLLTRHALRAGNKLDAVFVADSVNKHCKQMITDNVHMMLDGDRRVPRDGGRRR